MTMTHSSDGRPRARGLGITLPGEPGPLNAITDVGGVEVGVTTLIGGTSVRTGVTAILPRGREGIGQPCAAGWYSLNGNGEMTGTTWIDEAGSFNLPVVLSNTHAIGACHTGVVGWVNRINPRLARQWLLPVCAETWDGYLNDINGGHVRPEHVEAALDAATGGPVAEGSVGGGTGMNCYEFKGGNGTASQAGQLRATDLHGWSVRAGELRLPRRIDRCRKTCRPRVARRQPAGQRLVRGRPRAQATARRRLGHRDRRHRRTAAAGPVQGSGAARSAWAWPEPARRAATSPATSSWPSPPRMCPALASAFPVGPVGDDEFGTLTFVPWGRMDDLYTAVVQAVEEAVLNALVVNDDMVGRDGHRSPALPHERLLALLGQRT